jgi:hypothetical protein
LLLLDELCVDLALRLESVVKILGLEKVELRLILHQLDLEVLIGLIVIGNQIIDALEKRSQSPAVILLLKEELSLRENLDKVHQPITSFTTKLLCVGRKVGDYRNDRLVDGLQ